MAIAPRVSECVVGEMSLVQDVTASLDEVLIAVNETARGRWFLESYEARLRGAENNRILEAINKLENHIQSISISTGDADLVKLARNAIAAARRDITALEPSIQGLSTEGRLFAHLADKARAAFTGAPQTNQSVTRALQLVSDLDREFSKTEPAEPFSKPIQLFKQDEAIFEPAPKQALAPARAPSGLIETSPRGAKLLVQRVGAPSLPAAESSAQVVELIAPGPEAAPILSTTVSSFSPLAEAQKSRIVIIRRKADEMESVALLDHAEPQLQAPGSAA